MVNNILRWLNFNTPLSLSFNYSLIVLSPHLKKDAYHFTTAVLALHLKVIIVVLMACQRSVENWKHFWLRLKNSKTFTEKKDELELILRRYII